MDLPIMEAVNKPLDFQVIWTDAPQRRNRAV